MYQEAIEANYSHEQMTPLNCIIGNSKIIQSRFIELHHYIKKALPNDQNTLSKNEETFKMLLAIQQSGVSMWFYNQN